MQKHKRNIEIKSTRRPRISDQFLTKLNDNINKAIQEIREENKLEDYEKDKIIDLDRDVILKNYNYYQI